MNNKENYKVDDKVYFYCEDWTAILRGEIERIDVFPEKINYQIWAAYSGSVLISNEDFISRRVDELSDKVMAYILRKIAGRE